ncbi:MAG: SnoaL-like domain-containing protein [Flavobacteriaceae bacterium]|nr:SnoaL-like domain-containing protein [Flavobacteriaceae bacterium]
MKTKVLLIMLFFTCMIYSQKSKSGAVYNEHPAIDLVEAMQQAYVKADTIALAKYLADDFKSYNGFNANPDAKGTTKENLINQSKWWNKNIAYLSISRSNGAYPDAVEYKDGELWVHTWDNMRGVHDETGVKIDMPIHRLFVVNKDNKIKTMISYEDGRKYNNVGDSFTTRTNGTIYNHHENINKVLRMMAALEHGDIDKAFSFFNEKARFSNLDMEDGKYNSVKEEKEGFKKMLESWKIERIDVRGYPDYLEYELGETKVVQSWWNVRLERKSDGKKVKLPLMLTHNFNDDGEITREEGYYTLAALNKE